MSDREERRAEAQALLQIAVLVTGPIFADMKPLDLKAFIAKYLGESGAT